MPMNSPNKSALNYINKHYRGDKRISVKEVFYAVGLEMEKSIKDISNPNLIFDTISKTTEPHNFTEVDQTLLKKLIGFHVKELQ